MSIELRNELMSLLTSYSMYGIEEVHVLIAKYTEKDLQEAVLAKDFIGNLLLHCACYHHATFRGDSVVAGQRC